MSLFALSDSFFETKRMCLEDKFWNALEQQQNEELPKEIGILTLNFFLLVKRWCIKIWSTSKKKWCGAAPVWISEFTTPFLPFLEKSLINFGKKFRKTGPQCNQLESKHEWSLYLVILVECTGSFRNANSPVQWLMAKGRIKRTLNQLLHFLSLFSISGLFDNMITYFCLKKSGLDLGPRNYKGFFYLFH